MFGKNPTENGKKFRLRTPNKTDSHTKTKTNLTIAGIPMPVVHGDIDPTDSKAVNRLSNTVSD